MKLKNKLFAFFGLWYCTMAFGQLSTYGYKQELKGISEQWHTITLPNQVFNEANDALSDIRIYGITKKDTLEAPYVLKIASEKNSTKETAFKLLNTASNKDGYYFTYEIPTTELINQIDLRFNQTNFNWHVVLEGSQTQNKWFKILDEYRILSIKNDQTNYRFSTLNFPSSKYKYYRLLIKSKVKPELSQAKISLDGSVNAKYNTYPTTFMNIDQKGKTTVVDIDVNQRLPISFLKLNVSDKVDYYRPITLQYISDSIQTEKGLKYTYKNLYRGTLSSVDTTGFKFTTLTQKIRVIVENSDNQALQIESATIKGYNHELVARFDNEADYFLVYGKKNAQSPQYDIQQITPSIPKNVPSLDLGEVQEILKPKKNIKKPLFESKVWLWMVMGIIILVLGWFTLRMMAKR
ncbi:DUF3999 family protein [Zobellia alginiliquefaciens]|uniref:DUF3999 family protein n=1 Tax=Zobellia alginiliquefaciens TaxID=3032586 RepID=UPI0023E35960|nr:DUF3999 family protein [Zobellia alginiliquefaciens]